MRKSELYGVVFDNHMHLRTDGLFLDAVDLFIKSGGNAINLVNLPDYTLPPSGYYDKIYDRTVRMAEIIRKERDVAVVVTIGPYPLDYFYFSEKGQDAEKTLMSGIDLAMRYIGEGKANALGEIGRPHFTVQRSVMDAANRVLTHGFEMSSDGSNPVILHTEDLDSKSYDEISSMAEHSNMQVDRVIKHHADPSDLTNETKIVKSILATRKNVREALVHKKDFLLETDYVDDISKPDKVIPPDSVPKRAYSIIQQYQDWEDIFERIFSEVPTRLYGEDAFR